MARVTVLLTCYNHLEFLPACLESVRAQTFRDFEVIALDDGSSDGTREWLEEHSEGVRLVFNEENLGTYGSLDVGLALAEGEFVAVLNDDDVWAPEKLAEQVALMDARPELGLVHTGGRFIDSRGEVTPGNPLGFAFPTEIVGDVLLALIYANKIIASSVLARKRCFDELGGFEPSYFGSGDWQMWLRIAEKYPVGFVGQPLTDYRVHGSNASHKLERIWRDDLALREWIVSKYPDYLARETDPHELRRAMAHNWACLGTVRTLCGDPRGGRAAYLRSLALEPGRAKSLLRYAATFLPSRVFRKLL